MSFKTVIEWANSTWNPLRGVKGLWSCIKVSEGCLGQHCYAERLNVRFGGSPYTVGADTLRLDAAVLTQPLRWKRPRKIFVQSMSDLFEERVPDEWIERIFDVMWQTDHTFLVLTKRAERMQRVITSLLSAHGMRTLTDAMLEKIWLGVSAENQARADERIPWLLKTPAAVRFLSVEPLLGPVNIEKYLVKCEDITHDHAYEPRVSWVICGGESGGPPERALVERCPGWRPDEDRRGSVVGCALPHEKGFHAKPEALEWVRALRNQCQAAEVPFFLKGWGGPRPTSGGRLLDGRMWDEFPKC